MLTFLGEAVVAEALDGFKQSARFFSLIGDADLEDCIGVVSSDPRIRQISVQLLVAPFFPINYISEKDLPQVDEEITGGLDEFSVRVVDANTAAIMVCSVLGLNPVSYPTVLHR